MADPQVTEEPHQGQYKLPKHWGKVDIKKVIDGEAVVYLRRWYLFRCKSFSIRLHHIMQPDVDRWPHDHPWPFLSFILRGGYRERWDTAGHHHPRFKKHVRRVNWHSRTDLHLIDTFDRGPGIHGGSWTLMFTGPERKKAEGVGWGFQTPDGWVPWNRYAPAGPVGPAPERHIYEAFAIDRLHLAQPVQDYYVIVATQRDEFA